MFKKVMMCLVLIGVAVSPAFADFTKEQWGIDYGLCQKYLSSEPKDYLGAIQLARKWRDFAGSADADLTSIAGAGVSKDALEATVNNLYREAVQVLANNYNSLLAVDPLKAAEFAVNVQQFFKGNPDLLKESAGAHGTTPAAMAEAIDRSAKDGFLKTYEACAKAYSTFQKEAADLRKAGKDAEAKAKEEEAQKLSTGWATVISDWNAHNSPLPKQFEAFAGVEPAKTVDTLKAFEKDYAAWREAVARGDEKTAFGLVDKWVATEKEHPELAQALSYLWNQTSGTGRDSKTDWKQNFNVGTYLELWKFDLAAYKAAVAAGKLDDAKKLIGKWETIFAGEFGKSIADHLGTDLDKAKAALAEEKGRLGKVDPAFKKENMASFKVDLDEYNKRAAEFHAAQPGSDAWYNAAARAGELCDKWSRIARENPTLAGEIKVATGISLPGASDDVITYLLDKTLTDSAAKFNEMLGKGELKSALDLVKSWIKYLQDHPQVNQLAKDKYGKDFFEKLQNYEKGLTTMVTQPARAAEPAQTAGGETTATATETETQSQTTPGTLGQSGN